MNLFISALKAKGQLSVILDLGFPQIISSTLPVSLQIFKNFCSWLVHGRHSLAETIILHVEFFLGWLTKDTTFCGMEYENPLENNNNKKMTTSTTENFTLLLTMIGSLMD